MKSLRAAASRLLTVGVISGGWYAILTGLVLLFLAYLLGSVPWDVDPAATPVAMVFLVMSLWQLTRGLRAELPRQRKPTGRAA